MKPTRPDLHKHKILYLIQLLDLGYLGGVLAPRHVRLPEEGGSRFSVDAGAARGQQQQGRQQGKSSSGEVDESRGELILPERIRTPRGTELLARFMARKGGVEVAEEGGCRAYDCRKAVIVSNTPEGFKVVRVEQREVCPSMQERMTSKYFPGEDMGTDME